MATDCIFCAIVTERGAASIVAADERCIAFLDIQPVGPGHTLVVPRSHVVGLTDLDPLDGAAMVALAQRVAVAQRQAGLADGVNLFLADGEVAGQEVFHVHLHVVPRRPGDAMRVEVDYGAPPARAELDEVAARLAGALPPSP